MIVESRGHSEIVWDEGRCGTAQAPTGTKLRVGGVGDWAPEQMLAAAAQSSLMMEFLRLAEGANLNVLGFVSSGEARVAALEGRSTGLFLSPCVVVGTEEDARRATALVAIAQNRSPVCRLFHGSVEIDPHVVVVRPAPG